MVIFVIIGFIAQMIDGALGMAYGVSATTFLLNYGTTAAVASASVHAAEVFTTGASGISHIVLGNIDKNLVKRLLIPGVIGAVLGAYILSALPGKTLRPFVSAYLLIMGVFIFTKAFRKPAPREVKTKVVPLAFMGGFLDAMGGGGWGPIVVATLVARGSHPRSTIGSVNLVEFFVALAATVTFIIALGISYGQIVLGLAIGGVIAAPLAAFVTKKLPTRAFMILVALLIVSLSIRILYETLR